VYEIVCSALARERADQANQTKSNLRAKKNAQKESAVKVRSDSGDKHQVKVVRQVERSMERSSHESVAPRVARHEWRLVCPSSDCSFQDAGNRNRGAKRISNTTTERESMHATCYR
jgi:hypothetical protein